MSSATNEKSPKTTTITNTSNTTIVQNKSIGADAAAVATAIGNQLNRGLETIAQSQQQFLSATTAGLNTLSAGEIAAGNGGQLETSGARSVSDAAQISSPLLIGAAILAAAFLFSRKG